ncbi:MAG: anti-sigma F factor [Hyphomicrobiales bacterium]|nr:MAG: anti-sigma F factor [Hyphomicrobiales bacterium]
MKTDDLAAVLAADAQRVDTASLTRATGLIALAGLAVTSCAILLMFGARADLAVAMATAPVLAKLTLGASVAGFSLVAFQRSLRPGRATVGALWFVMLPLAAVFAWALATLAGQPAGEWAGPILGRSWRACLISVTLYAMLPFAALLALARFGAPVKPRLTGIAAGLGAAGLATVAYALHCPEDALPFIASWYPLAMGISATIGAVAAPRLLRW